MKDVVSKYLSQYAHTPEELTALEGHWDISVTIPCYGENVLSTLQSLEEAAHFSNKTILVVLVINEREASPAWVKQANQKTQLEIQRWPTTTPMKVVGIHRKFNEKEGVGLARKMGADALLWLHTQGQVTSPWIYFTDADAGVSEDYFESAVDAADNTVALTHRFVHIVPPELNLTPEEERAGQLYDQYLRYYVEGLTYAGSPYAFHTVGSTMAAHARAYAAVRGVPNRLAGEDFYLLNKLAKLGEVVTPSRGQIQLQARPSQRVPFGTGRAIGDISQQLSQGQPYRVYHPDCFVALKKHLDRIRAFAEGDTASPWPEWSDPELPTVAEKAKQQRGLGDSLLQDLHRWFDGFRTLRFIHRLRDKHFGTIELNKVFTLMKKNSQLIH